MPIKTGEQTTEFKTTIGFMIAMVIIIIAYMLIPEANNRIPLETVLIIFGLGGAVSTGSYSISRGIAKTGRTVIESTVSELSREPEISSKEKARIEALKSQARQALIELQNKGVDISDLTA